ncbi:Bacterial extracellular solute-binding protein, family 5 Middle [Aureliella helgolandensis]|uniref:Bacterial extracellular solute-binding protein, family 5 Middle n=2 Tax=Aureliella helgolandensis TaxID=2527968 RepID=A0A518GFL6_9BACT|nr:Bacterial extracellular solute-binding protein, family 5 Middle [Aureliella helgolandensis]
MCVAWAVVWGAAGQGSCFAQEEIEVVEPPLIDQQPFDLITLKPAAGGDSVKVLTLPFPGRVVPSNPKETEKLPVVLVRFQERKYEVLWRDIERVELYEQRIYQQALDAMENKDFIGAFQNLSFLMKNYPGMRQLESLRQEFLFRSAVELYTSGALPQTLSALEELKETAPGYRAAAVNGALSRVADSMMGEYLKNGDLSSAKKILKRLNDQYGASLPVVKQWQAKLEAMAQAKRREAVALMEAQDYRAARKAAVDMLSILPDLKEAQDLINEINRIHPMVRVGVMQRSRELDPASLVNWPARRAGSLVYQSLFDFVESGPEGGKYRFALGTYALSDDRQQLILSLDPSLESNINAYDLAQILLERAELDSDDYDASWAAIFRSVSVPSSQQVLVQLKRPNVLPHALLQWTIPAGEGDASEPQESKLPGEYRIATQDETETSFKIRPAAAQRGAPVEIVEVFYTDPKLAVNDLLRGEIDLLDQLYPADAKRLAADPRLRVAAYSLPTTHMLIPVSDDPYVQNTKFRRALLYATNREAMLTGELLNSQDWDDGRLVSGPFPLGNGESDPLAYAYNPEVKPIEYSPQLAKLLVVMAEKELDKAAEKQHKPTPERKQLVIACPDFEFARVAVQGMIQQWQNVGIAAEMLVLPPGESVDESIECDFVYVITTMWEPATDIERLLGGDGIATSDNPFIVQALEQLRAARNWREVRDAMQNLHQLIDYHLPVLPLWQVTDRFAVSRYVEGLEGRPVSLYQDVDAWRVNLGIEKTLGR